MTVHDTLMKAADLIEERGWTQGTGWNGVDGAPLCVEGALLAVTGLQRGVPDDLRTYYTACPAYDAVVQYLDRVPQPTFAPIVDALWQWNDATDRTAAEVVEVLRAAAAVSLTREPVREDAEAVTV